MRVSRLAWVGAFSILSMAGCSSDTDGTPQATTPSGKQSVSKVCGGGTLQWRQVSEKWDLVVLDGPTTVSPGEKISFEGTPHAPWAVRATGGGGSVSDAFVLEALSEKVNGPLEDAGERTTKLSREMSADFNGDSQAQAVYYRGVRKVEADYALHCSKKEQEIKGKVTTWKSESNTTGLINCAEPLQENPVSKLADLAIEERCSSSSVAAKELAAKPSGARTTRR